MGEISAPCGGRNNIFEMVMDEGKYFGLIQQRIDNFFVFHETFRGRQIINIAYNVGLYKEEIYSTYIWTIRLNYCFFVTNSCRQYHVTIYIFFIKSLFPIFSLSCPSFAVIFHLEQVLVYALILLQHVSFLLFIYLLLAKATLEIIPCTRQFDNY